ncbi:MAG: orotate phosphoribosyltransferase [Myxococcota bacterium]|jgi:orotate phosphoribosyltransferase
MDRLTELLREKAVRTGSFTLASGKKSDLYVDARQVTLHAEGCRLIAEAILDRLHPEVHAIGGLTMGADPVACSVAALSTLRGRPVHAFLIRKKPKGHGTGGVLEGMGNVPAGTSVAVVEDTTTTGSSLLEAVARAKEGGLHVVQCITVVDRQEGAAEAVAAAGLTLEALVTRELLLSDA